MISSLRGTVLSALGSSCVIEVGGVGFAITVTPAHAASLRVGEQALVVTTLIVRDDSLSLFGFASAEHLAVFELLTSVPGVGPKSAMGVLSAVEPVDVATAVEAEDDAVFRRVSGIGPKTAKLIVVQLSGKLKAMSFAGTASPDTVVELELSQSVIAALVSLGWSERVASDVLRELLAENPKAGDEGMPAVLRLALARLGPGGVRV